MTRSILLLSAVLLSSLALQAETPTWSRDVSRIAQIKCQRCHRPNDIAPFALTTYEEAAKWAEDIGHAVGSGHMPPWKPVPGHGNFRDNFGLTEDERQTILAWVAGGAPEGDPADLPEPLPETGEWELGEPDQIIEMPESFTMTRGQETNRCFVLPVDLPVDRFVAAAQVKPGNRNIVHHAIVFLDTTGQAEKLDAAEEGPGYTCFGGPGIKINAGLGLGLLDSLGALGGWVPGARVQRLPEGVGIFLSKKARIVLQLHYNAFSRGGEDKTRIGLYFSKEGTVERRLMYVPVLNSSFVIPPGAEDYEVKASLRVPFFFDAKAIQIIPHMHTRGRQIKVELERSDTVESMIRIDKWDFNWQNFYMYEDPVPMPAGSTVRLSCRFDNSGKGGGGHGHGPEEEAPKEVRWGESTSDEMCLVFLGLTFDRFSLLPFGTQPGRR